MQEIDAECESGELRITAWPRDEAGNSAFVMTIETTPEGFRELHDLWERHQALVAAVMAGVDPDALPPERRPRGNVRACLMRAPIVRLRHRLEGESG